MKQIFKRKGSGIGVWRLPQPLAPARRSRGEKSFETAARSQARPGRPPFGRRGIRRNAFLLSAKHPPQPLSAT